MYTFLTVLAFLAAVILVFVVLIQNSKGGGLASSFSSSNQIMGVRKTTDFLEKFTWGLIGFIIIVSVFSTSFISDSEMKTGVESSIKSEVQNAVNVDPNVVAPDFNEQK